MYSNDKNSLNSNRDGFYIGSDGIALGGYSSGHNPFQVTNDGTLYSKKGTIGGFTITDQYLEGSQVGIGSRSGNRYAFYAGPHNIASGDDAPFRVGHDGHLKATSADITGNINANTGRIGNWTIENGKISNGYVTLTGNGQIYASSGSIGNWAINGNDLTCGNMTLSGGTSYDGGRIVWIDGGRFFAAGAGSNHPVASSFSTNGDFVIRNGMGIDGGGTYVGKIGNDNGKVLIEGNTSITVRSSGNIYIKPTGVADDVAAIKITPNNGVVINGFTTFQNDVYFSKNIKTYLAPDLTGGLSGEFSGITVGVKFDVGDILGRKCHLVFANGLLVYQAGPTGT